MTIEIIHVHSDVEYEIASELFTEYALNLNIDLSFQNFGNELLGLKEMYGYPHGGIILLKSEDEYLGCVAIRKQAENVAELKRMYIRPGSQGKGSGSLLLNEIEKLASDLGYKKIRLDTLDTMIPAMSLYRKNGYEEIKAYYNNPLPSAVYFEKTLR